MIYDLIKKCIKSKKDEIKLLKINNDELRIRVSNYTSRGKCYESANINLSKSDALELANYIIENFNNMEE